MQKKLAELIFLGMKNHGKDFDGAPEDIKARYTDMAKIVLLSIDKLNMEIAPKEKRAAATKSVEKKTEAIAAFLPEALAQNSFIKRGLPKVAPEFWVELAKKIVAI
jgi:hypothetical protein